jgi:hypothetical protein
MASEESKHKCNDKEDRVSAATSKRRRLFGDYNADADNNNDDSNDDSLPRRNTSGHPAPTMVTHRLRE